MVKENWPKYRLQHNEEEGDLGNLIGAISFGQPVWPCSWDQEIAMVAFYIHGLQVEILKLEREVERLNKELAAHNELPKDDPRSGEVQ